MWSINVSTFSVTGRVWHQVEMLSVQTWNQWNWNKADGNGNWGFSELKAVFKRRSVSWISRATSRYGQQSPNPELCFQDITSVLSFCYSKFLLAISASITYLLTGKQMNSWCVGRQSRENGGCMCTLKTCFQGWFSLGKLEMGFIKPSAEFWDEAVSCLLTSSHLQKTNSWDAPVSSSQTQHGPWLHMPVTAKPQRLWLLVLTFLLTMQGSSPGTGSGSWFSHNITCQRKGLGNYGVSSCG